MNELHKAAQIAVEALEADPDDMVEVTKDHWEYKREQAWKILRAALAQERSDVQPEPVPVLHKWAALFEDPNNAWQAGYEHARRWVLEVGLQSIAAPPQRKPLTNGEIYTAYITATNQTLRAQDEKLALEFARAIERAHGIGGEE